MGCAYSRRAITATPQKASIPSFNPLPLATNKPRPLALPCSSPPLHATSTHHQGVLGPQSGYVWFLTDAVTGSIAYLKPYLVDANPCPLCGEESEAPPALTEAEAASALKGAVGMAPVADFGELSSVYTGWASRFAALPDTTGHDPSTGGACPNALHTVTGDLGTSKTNAPAGVNCTCSVSTE